MYYCFVSKDIKELDERNPLMLQIKYAKKIGMYLCCNIENKTVVDVNGNIINVHGLNIFLRTSYNLMELAIKQLEEQGAILLETIEDIEQIEQWSSYNISERAIYTLSVRELIQSEYTLAVKALLCNNETAFLKTKKKGFSMQVETKKILQQDSDVLKVVERLDLNDELIIAENLVIRKDSLGKKEVRLVVLNGTIINASRTLHSVKHFVPSKWIIEAEKFVEKIACIRNFTSNYILDIGEFEKNGERFWDVIELNPITCSLCYVNNSIYTQCIDEAKKWYDKTGMGYEYCYDAHFHPEQYILERNASGNYEYINTGRFMFEN